MVATTTLVPLLSMHQTTTQEVTKGQVTTDNLLMDNKYKEVKLGDKVKVNKEVMDSRVVLMDNNRDSNKEVDTVSKEDNKAVRTVNKVPPMGNKVLDNTTLITVQRK